MSCLVALAAGGHHAQAGAGGSGGAGVAGETYSGAGGAGGAGTATISPPGPGSAGTAGQVDGTAGSVAAGGASAGSIGTAGAAGATSVTANSGLVIGGGGGGGAGGYAANSAGAGGGGGAGISLTPSNDLSFTNNAGGTIYAGSGGGGGGGYQANGGLGGAGGTGFELKTGSGLTGISIFNSGAITAGRGGQGGQGGVNGSNAGLTGGTGGAGGAGALLSAAATFTINSGASVQGGSGGTGGSGGVGSASTGNGGNGGPGGSGVTGSTSLITNYGTVRGGTGGTSTATPGAGGNGANVYSLVNNGTITGGNAGTANGTGSALGGRGAQVSNLLANNGTGVITGGQGSAGTVNAPGGGGGMGVLWSGSSQFTNNGTITGGAGGAAGDATYKAGGTGGIGVSASGTGKITNYANGLIQGGAGGAASASASAGAGGAAISVSNAATNIANYGAIVGGAGATTGAGITASTTGWALVNGQGGAGTSAFNTALTFTGYLPTSYRISITDQTRYGQLAVASPVRQITSFGIDNGSTVRAGTYTGVFTGLADNGTSGLTAAKSGTYTNNGTQDYTWALTNQSGSTTAWDLTLFSKINTNQTYFEASLLGAGVLPDFQNGTLRADQNNASYSQNFAVNAASGNTIDQYGNAATFSGTFSDASGVTGQLNIANSAASSAGGITFTGDNTYTGTTSIGSNARLILGDGGTSGWVAGDVSIADGGELRFARSDDKTVLANIVSAQTGQLRQTGTGKLTLAGTTSFDGQTYVDQGTLQVGDGGTSGSITGDATVNTGAVLAFNRSDDVSYGGGISGAGALIKSGAGTLILTGTSSQTGGTTVTGGTLQIGNGGTTGTIVSDVVTASGAALAFNRSDDMSYAGQISGAGVLLKTGAGKLTLTADNSFTGLTEIQAGTLQIGDGGTSGSLAGAILNDATLVINRSDSYAFTNTLTGSGLLAFEGGSTVNLDNLSGYTGTVATTGTTLVIANGTTTSASVLVDSGGRLKGNGTIGGLAIGTGGTLAPGNSPGTIQVNGAVDFAAGSAYDVDVTPTGAHDLILATGPVTISSGAVLNVIAEPGTYAPLSTYSVLNTTGSLTGQFGQVTSDYAFLTPTLSYDLQNVFLTLAYDAGSPDIITYAKTANQRATANGVQALGLGTEVFDAVIGLSAGAVPGALDALSGEIYATATGVLQQQSLSIREAVEERLGSALADEQAFAEAGAAPAMWAHVLGGEGNTDGDGNAADVSTGLGGFVAGLDVAAAANWRAGFFGSFSQSHYRVDDRNSSGNATSYGGGIYAGGRSGAASLRAGAALVWNDMSANRNIAIPGYSGSASGDYGTTTAQIFGEAAFDVTLGSALLQPFAGLAYVKVAGSAFEEDGDSAALDVDTKSMDTVYAAAGLRAATTVPLKDRSLVPSAALAWQGAFGDTTPAASMNFDGGTTPFTISGAALAEDTLLVKAGLALDLADKALLAVDYWGQFGAGTAQNAFTARFSVSF